MDIYKIYENKKEIKLNHQEIKFKKITIFQTKHSAHCFFSDRMAEQQLPEPRTFNDDRSYFVTNSSPYFNNNLIAVGAP